MRIEPFKPEHAMILSVRDTEKDMKQNKDFAKWAEVNATGTSYSAFHGDTLIGCGGIRTLWDGVGEGWVLFSTEVVNHKVSIRRYVNKYFKKIIEENNLHRVQAHVNCEWGLALRFADSLGFEVEGRMVKFNPDGTDSYLFAWVR